MKEIQLTKGFVTQVDDEDYEYLSQFKWHYKNGYATRDFVYKSKRTILKMANAIMKPPEGLIVDHIDRNPLNNQQYNLRICTNAQNTQNAIRRIGSSKYRGVSRHHDKRRNKPPCWCVWIRINSKPMFLGHFDDAIEAAHVYDTAAKKYHGEFAVLNFPEETQP